MAETSSQKLIWPGLAALYEKLAPCGYGLMRFAAGAVVVYHGYAKLFLGFAGPVAQNVLAPLGLPAPLAWAYWLGVLELVGGAFLAIGLLTAPRGGWEFPALLTLLYIGILFRGGGRCSVDRLIGREF